jgi:hypothetical protein
MKQNIKTFKSLPILYFWFFTTMVLLKLVHSLKICQNTKFNGPTLTGTSLHLPQMFDVRHFGMFEDMGLKFMPSEVTFNGMSSVLDFIKI